MRLNTTTSLDDFSLEGSLVLWWGMRLMGSSGASNWLLGWLVSYYKSDSNSSFPDSHWSNTGITNWPNFTASWKIEWAYSYITNDFTVIDWVATDMATATQGTFSAWLNLDLAKPTGDGMIIWFWDANWDTRLQFDVTWSNAWDFRAFMEISTSNKWLVETTTAPFTSWVYAHVALVQDWVEPVLYVNWVAPSQWFTVTTDKTAWFNDAPWIDNWNIGCIRFGNLWNHKFLAWDVDEIAFYDRALTADEISALYNGWAWLSYDDFTT